MSKLFFMQKVKEEESFIKAVTEMAKRKNVNLLHCYVCGDIFNIATAKKVQQFDFSSFDSDEVVIRFIQIAIEILRENFPQQILLFDEVAILNFSLLDFLTMLKFVLARLQPAFAGSQVQ